jgi:hypothetical protein
MAIAANANARPTVDAVASLDATSGATSSGLPDSANGGADAAQFAAHFNSLGGVDALRRPVARAAPSVPEPSKLEQLSAYFKDRGLRHVAEMAQVVRSRDSAALVRVSAEGIDMGVQSDLVSKFIGKSVSAVDAITKLN